MKRSQSGGIRQSIGDLQQSLGVLDSRLKDFESLEKLAARFGLALFALAFLVQPPYHHWVLDEWPFTRLIPYLSLTRPLFERVVSVLTLLLIYAVLSLVALLFVTLLINLTGYGLLMLFRLPAKHFAPVYFWVVASPFLCFGLLALTKFTPHDDPLPGLSIFWELALCCYEIFLLS